MGYDKKTKKELVEIIEILNRQNGVLQRQLNSSPPEGASTRRLSTIEYLYDRSQLQLKESIRAYESLHKLLEIERFDSAILLKIQDQLITLLNGKVWICPSCGKVVSGNNGPHLIICTDCASKRGYHA